MINNTPPSATDPAETLGVLLAGVRTALGLSQLRLAERLCAAAGTATLTRHEISRWEREERVPHGYWLAWLALVLDQPLARLEAAAAATRRRRRDAAGVYPAQALVSRARADRAGARWVRHQPGVYVRIAA